MTECLELTQILQYLENRLSLEQKEDIESHLVNCSSCREEVILAAQVFNDKKYSRWDTVNELSRPKLSMNKFYAVLEDMAAFFKNIMSFRIQEPAYALVRGDQNKIPDTVQHKSLTKTFHGLKVEFFLERVIPPMVDIRINLYDIVLSSEKTRLILQREDGKFEGRYYESSVIFDDIPYGCHQLLIEQGDSNIGTVLLGINEAGFYEFETES